MRKIKVISVLLSTILVLGILAGCGASVIEKPVAGENVTMVQITGFCEIEVEGSTITVKGETSFITGTLIHISIVAQNGMEIDSVIITKAKDAIEQTFQITENKYGNDVTSFTAFISVAPTLYGKQNPESVLIEYGEKFELISGDHIWNKDGIIVMFASKPHKR